MRDIVVGIINVTIFSGEAQIHFFPVVHANAKVAYSWRQTSRIPQLASIGLTTKSADNMNPLVRLRRNMQVPMRARVSKGRLIL